MLIEEPSMGSIVADSDGDFWHRREDNLWYMVELWYEHTGIAWGQLEENSPLVLIWSPPDAD